jgi:hypothetical protein
MEQDRKDKDQLRAAAKEEAGPVEEEWAETDPDRVPAGSVSARSAEKLWTINGASPAPRSPARSAARG